MKYCLGTMQQVLFEVAKHQERVFSEGERKAGLHHTEVRIGDATTKWAVAVTARIAPRIN